MSDYLRQLRGDPERVLAAVAAGDGNGAQRAVARTWSVTIDMIAEQSPMAVRLLQVLACYAPDDLPRDVLTPVAEPGAADGALGVLASYNMITLTGQAVTTHRLVQAITMSQLRQPVPDAPSGDNHAAKLARPPKQDAQDLRTDTLRIAVELLRQAVPPGHPATALAGWPRWAALSPHVAALADQCPDHIGGLDLAWLFGQTALFERAQGRHRQALIQQQRALAITENALGPDHPDTATRLDKLAMTLWALGRAGDAEPLVRRALAITENALGPEHPDAATRLSNLARTLWTLGRAGDAEPLQRRALAITENTLGPDHPHMATRLDNLGITLWTLGRARDAEPLQRRALAITENALGPDHPDTADRLDNLGITLSALGRAGDAEPLQRRALAITENTFGPDHPDMADKLDTLADSLSALGRTEDAEQLQRRAAAIREVQ
ncbi:tetratricopeptide repeat protein [Dactylosporangium darangshiense]